MADHELNIDEIYKVLEAGKKIALQFSSQVSMNSFKTALYRYKKKIEDMMAAVGEEKDKSLSFSPRMISVRNEETSIEICEAIIQLQDFTPKRTYTITILEDKED